MDKIYAQANPYIDSLKNILSNSKNAPDSVKILCKLTWTIYGIDKEAAINYGIQALKTSKNTSDSSLIADAYDAAAKACNLKGDRLKEKELSTIALEIGLRNNLIYRTAWSYYHLANLYISEGNFKKAEMLAKKSSLYFYQKKDYRRAFNCYWLLINANQKQYTDSLINLITNYLPEIDEEARLFYLLELSNLYNIKENRNKAMYYVQMAMDVADKNKNTKGISKAYYIIAGYLSDIQQNYTLALTYYKKILEIRQENKTKEIGDLYIQIGEMHRLMGNDSLALLYFNKGLENGQERKHRHTIAIAFMKLGEYNYQNHNYKNALNYYLKCYETGCDVCPRIKFHDALIKIGNVYLFSNDFRNAYTYYQKSIELADSFSYNQEQVASYQSFAGLYEKQGQINKAVNYYLKAYNLSKSIKFLEGQQFNAGKLGSVYSLQNNHRKAYEYLNIAKVLSDSIREMNHADNLAKLETYFDFKNQRIQRELDKVKSDEEITRQKLLRNSFIVGLIFSGIIGFMIYIGYRRKKKDNVLLHEQKLAIENMSKKVHEADQAKLQFYTNVSHELRTPLTIIMGITEKLKSALHENQNIQTIRKNSLKLLQLINHLLDLRKLDESKMKLCITEGNIVNFIKGIISSFEEYARQKSITIELYPDNKEITGFFDHDKCEKIFSNLVSNAVKYNRENGQVRISVDKEDSGYARIEVNDNGIGIPEKEIKNIFTRFYRVPDNNEQGSGIGLALVKELVELHKGEISVNSIKNEGSSFVVKVPVEKHFYSGDEISQTENEKGKWNYAETMYTDDEFKDEKSNEAPNVDKETILIVEDNTDLRKYIAGIFTGEYEIIEASNGEDGYKLSLEYVPDIIISDIVMPKLSGIQLVEKVKNCPATSHIPIILLTAKNDMGTRLNSFEKGADEYISKPFESVILKSRVENLLRLRKLLVEKFSKQFQLQPKEITIDDADQKFLQKTIDTIENHISNPNLNVDFLAMELCVSRTQLYRKLKALTDYSANQFIRIIRLKRAAQILRQGQNNIAEVMDATGFSNYSYFNNCFKEYFGEFPKDYVLLSIEGNSN